MAWNDARKVLTLRLAAGSRILPPAKRDLRVKLGESSRSAVFEGKPLEMRFRSERRAQSADLAPRRRLQNIAAGETGPACEARRIQQVRGIRRQTSGDAIQIGTTRAKC